MWVPLSLLVVVLALLHFPKNEISDLKAILG